MNWVPDYNSNPNPQDRPRYLTDSEIKFISDQIQVTQGVAGPPIELATNELRIWYQRELSQFKISPSMILELSAKIVSRHKKALVEIGDAIGIDVASALGQLMSQMTLKSFHTSGAVKNIASSVTTIRELIFTRKKRKINYCNVYFKNKFLSFQDILEKRRSIVGVTISDLIDTNDDNYDVGTIGTDTDDFPFENWHGVYTALNNITLPSNNFICRIFLDVRKMYEMRITMEDACNAIRRSNEDIVLCIPSPMGWYRKSGSYDYPQSIIDIFAYENKAEAKLRSMKIPFEDRVINSVFFTMIVLQNLDKVYVKGIPNIKDAYPIDISVWSVVIDERQAIRDDLKLFFGVDVKESETKGENKYDIKYENFSNAVDSKQAWVLFIDDNQMLSTGITFEVLFRLLDTADIGHLSESNIITVYGKQRLLVISKDKPSQIISDAIKKDDVARNSVVDTERKRSLADSSKPFNLTEWYPNPIANAAKIYYIRTDGINLAAIFKRYDVDKRYTHSNNIHEIAEVIGNEAARLYFIKELDEAVRSSGVFINSRSIELIADALFIRGKPLGATFPSISKQKTGPIELATNQESQKVVKQGAIRGGRDNGSVTASIAFGQLIPVGMRFQEIVQEYKRSIEEKKLTQTNQVNQQVSIQNVPGIPNINPDDINNINVTSEMIEDLVRDIGNNVSTVNIEDFSFDNFNINPLPEIGDNIDIPPAFSSGSIGNFPNEPPNELLGIPNETKSQLSELGEDIKLNVVVPFTVESKVQPTIQPTIQPGRRSYPTEDELKSFTFSVSNTGIPNSLSRLLNDIPYQTQYVEPSHYRYQVRTQQSDTLTSIQSQNQNQNQIPQLSDIDKLTFDTDSEGELINPLAMFSD